MSDWGAEGGHWYEWSGKPAYDILGANGQMRRTTLRDARKYGYLPSFSGIWAIMAREPLEKWKRGKLLGICAGNPRRDDEGEQAYINRIMELYEANLAEAPDTGTDIHHCIDCHLTGKDYDQAYRTHTLAAVAAVDRWCGVDGLSTEKSFACALGYGGKCDAHKPGWLLDFKSFGKPGIPDAYDNHFAQLAAYRYGLGMPTARCAIIFISTLEPGVTHTIEIPEDDLEHGWEVFRAAFELWKIVKKYDPCKMKELTDGRSKRDSQVCESA